MAQYALIKDNTITNLYDSIPTSFGNEVSGFHLLSDEERESFGFFKIEQRVAFYDPELHEVTRDEYIFKDNRPVRVVEVKNRYTEEQLLEKRKQVFYNNLRSSRDFLLGKSDWAVAQDVIEAKGEEHYNAWKAYRQALRDLPSQDFSEIDWNINSVVYPSEPTL